nr:glycosyltransferase family 4 protein [Bacteroides sp.]
MERVLSIKANYLADKLGYEVMVVTTSQRSRKPFYSFSERIKFVDLGIDYEEIKMQPLVKRIKARIAAKRKHRRLLTDLLKEYRPDITVSMFTHEMTFLPSIKDGSKKVLELHFSKQFRTLDARSNGVSFTMRAINHILDYLDRRAIRAYDQFVVLSKMDAADWGKGYKNMTIISNPLSFEPLGSELSNLDTKRALAIGRLCPQKGFDTLLKVWATIPAEVRDKWTLDIVGSGPDEQVLRKAILEYNLGESVKILPPVQDVQSLYRTHSIFCFPSRYEGFGMAILEAMSFGLPPVSFNCPCGPAEIIDDKFNGFLIKQNDIHSFANALIQLMESPNLRSDMGSRAHKKATERFSVESTMNKWHNTFEHLRNEQ